MTDTTDNNGSRPAPQQRPGIKALIYHRIVEESTDGEGGQAFCTSIRSFEAHLRLLDRLGFTPITFEDYHLWEAGELDLPKKPVIITFDDGYLDTYELAFPMLKEYGMKAVIFVIADSRVRVNGWDSANGVRPAPLMSTAQIVEMHAAGFEIGSHSLTHPRLTDIPRGEAWEEISRSRILLEILLNSPVQTFSYPYGLVDDAIKEMVREAGYVSACGVYSGPARFGADRYNIRRLTPMNDPLSVGVGVQMVTPYEWYASIRWGAGRFMRKLLKKPAARQGIRTDA